MIAFSLCSQRHTLSGWATPYSITPFERVSAVDEGVPQPLFLHLGSLQRRQQRQHSNLKRSLPRPLTSASTQTESRNELLSHAHRIQPTINSAIAVPTNEKQLLKPLLKETIKIKGDNRDKYSIQIDPSDFTVGDLASSRKATVKHWYRWL